MDETQNCSKLCKIIDNTNISQHDIFVTQEDKIVSNRPIFFHVLLPICSLLLLGTVAFLVDRILVKYLQMKHKQRLERRRRIRNNLTQNTRSSPTETVIEIDTITASVLPSYNQLLHSIEKEEDPPSYFLCNLPSQNRSSNPMQCNQCNCNYNASHMVCCSNTNEISTGSYDNRSCQSTYSKRLGSIFSWVKRSSKETLVCEPEISHHPDKSIFVSTSSLQPEIEKNVEGKEDEN